MRIGILIYSLASGGAERVVSYLLSHFQSLNVETHLILMNNDIKFPIPDQVKVHYIETSQSNESGFLKILKIPYLSYKYAKYIKKQKLTHSLSLLTRPNYINILANYYPYKNKVRPIISERAFPSLQYGYSGLQSKINRFLISTLYPQASLIICNSNGNRRDLIENFGIHKKLTTVINNPIDIENIKQIPPIKGIFDAKFMNLITVGRLDEGKNHRLLINAISKIEDARLYIIGEGALRVQLERLIHQKGLEDKVFLLGYQSNPYQYLKGADLFIFGSNHEGFPNVLLEAMACGVPILTTNCKSGPNEIMEYTKDPIDGIMITKYGILVPIDNEKPMIDGINFFISNKEYQKNCKQKVLERVKDFDQKIIIKKFEETLLNKEVV